MNRLQLTYRDLPYYSLAAQQNAYRLFSHARLTYPKDEQAEAGSTLRNLTVRLECAGDILRPEVWEVAAISPGQSVALQDRSLQFSHDYLLHLTDETEIRYDLTVASSDNPDVRLLVHSETLTVFPANFWGGETRQPELLAAFVKPNGPYVESLVKKVTEVLAANGKGRSADGYQSNTREKPYLMAAALWSVVAAEKLSYVSPPPSYAYQGQLVRLASAISNQKMGACLDLSLLFASCLELMGLNTVIALTQDHAFVGVWLVDSMFPLLTTDDPMELRKRADANDLVLFETTLVTSPQAPTFLQACAHARSLIAEESEEQFVYAIDIAQARSRRIKPLATVEERPDESATETDGNIILPPTPPLPPVRMDERTLPETPATRIDGWQRKLLDLTKRNPLLAFKDRTVGVRIFCPDIAQMEDLLADGSTFSFISAEKSPLNDPERSQESFRLTTGNDLHREFARDQLGKGTLLANMPEKKLETTLVGLLRKAKNDLEEGGANTLFMALGMLAWKEHPEEQRVYKAPLVLIPVELVRKSANAPVRLRQLPDEEPLFNLSLIEFLQTAHDINLSHLREDLPVDESGLDIAAIWQDVREEVSAQRGFEVVEDCVIASFSFAKYLMWKDLKDRIDDLKKNPFVTHLVDHPEQAYQQDATFIRRSDIDQKIDPADIFTPLNCDSSQMVAVEASSRPQDFVLEGPPGTGKSETIANMIANNLAKGRKVLFVAEKIAALQVVYRRLEKIGLDHLALELHSNKANKKSVLDQLRRATEMRESKTAQQWLDDVERLRTHRDALNTFVRALHKPSAFGISPRAAIARLAGTDPGQMLQLRWGIHLSDCPVADQQGLGTLLAAARTAGVAYGDIRDLDPTTFHSIKAVAWSYSWQLQLIEALKQYLDVSAAAIESSRAFAAVFNLTIDAPSLKAVACLRALSELTGIAQEQSIAFALGPDARQRLDRLSELAAGKADLDERLKRIAHGASAQRLVESPVDQWINALEDAQKSWWKKLFVKGKVNKLARSHGYTRFSELDILYALKDARKMAIDIGRLAEDFTQHQIWNGWEAEPDRLLAKQAEGRRIQELVKKAIGLTAKPLDVLAAIKANLVDGREVLGGSRLTSEKIKFEGLAERLAEAEEALKRLNVDLRNEQSLEAHRNQLLAVVVQERKLKPWVEWNAARQQCEQLKIEPVTEALETGSIDSREAEDHTFTSFCGWLAPRLIDDSDVLRQFKASEHNQKLEAFRQLDTAVAKTTSDYVAALMAQKAPDIKSKENAPHFGTLSRELQKKTQHKPIRALFEDMGERLLDLCPCMMMSPLSVAQFLPSDFNAFDLVVFDEASQMTTWDSVGAIARGKNVVVVGDPKQMPPTNFFNATVDPDEPDEEDLESILDQALAAGLPHIRLMGHYRSRHETLIAFSNSKYYENALVTYPSADTKESAVILQRVNGVYAKGKGRNNPIEAKAVVHEVLRRLCHPELSKLSLGIVTMNADQQRTIEDLLDDARRRYPQIEQFFQATDDYDAVFVKNLESVQGDERDVIIFSLGYGPTEPGGKTMSMNFGPLNKQGGERRLNVAITRATTEVMVFASFDSSMIDLSRTSATAVEHLKHYMEFAEKGPVALSEQSTASYGVDQFDSGFEQAVAWALRGLGWQVQTQVGVSKFRIDLGVVHPDRPGVYLAGIECDGAAYHSSPSARDRDRTRHEILQRLGWRLIRLWSTDYFRDPDSAIQAAHVGLTELLNEDRARQPAQKPDAEADFVVDLDSPIDAPSTTEVEDDDEVGLQGGVAEYSASRYFEPSHEPVLTNLCREILQERPCITQKALAMEVAMRHGRTKTSKKQLELLSRLVEPWAGVLRADGHDPVCWASPEQVTDIVEWRGLSPFGYDRNWSEIAHPEALGLAREAIAKQARDPVSYICDAFALKRRASSTLAVFQSWVQQAKSRY